MYTLYFTLILLIWGCFGCGLCLWFEDEFTENYKSFLHKCCFYLLCGPLCWFVALCTQILKVCSKLKIKNKIASIFFNMEEE